MNLSEQHKNNISDGLKKAYIEGRRTPNYLLKHTDETKRFIAECSRNQVWTEKRKMNVSLALKGRCSDAKKRILLERNSSDSQREAVRHSAIKRVMNSSPTNIERIVMDELKSHGIEYEFQVVVENFVYDFRVGNILIECDGEYWHLFGSNLTRDHNKNECARRNGFDIVRIPGKRIMSDDFNIFDWVKA